MVDITEGRTGVSVAGRRSQARRRSGWRSWLATSLIVLAALLAPLAVVVGWARFTVLDTDRYVDTVAPLATDAAVTAAVTTEVARAVNEAVSGRSAILAAALPAGVVDEAVKAVVGSSAFPPIWEGANRAAHTQVVAVLTGRDSAALETDDGQVVVDLAAVVAEVEASLQEAGYDVDLSTATAGRSAELTLFESRDLASAQRVTRLFDRVGLLLPVATVVSLVLAVAVAPRRRRTIRRAGIGVALGMALVLGLLVVGRRLYLDAIGPEAPRDALAAVFDILTRSLGVATLALLAVGVGAAATAWLAERLRIPGP